MRNLLCVAAVACLSTLIGCTNGGDADPATDTALVSGDVWTLGNTPCSGSRVDALLCDNATTCYVGCGQNAEGDGLFMTSDAGATWSAPADEAGGYFATMRVDHISRGAEGLLYVAGEGDSSYRVISLDTSTGALNALYTNGTNVDFSFTAGSFARNSTTMVAESLTGTGIVVNHYNDSSWQSTHAENDGWASGYGWWNGSGEDGHVQVLDMTVVDDEILGVGSTINYPPVVYLPPRSFDFGSDSSGDDLADQMWESVVLNSESFSVWDGECWGIDGNADGLAVGCVDQDGDRGMVYTIGSDWKSSAYQAANWTETDMSTVVEYADPAGLGHSTWTRMVCRGDDNFVVAVGADTQDDAGWLAVSKDGGSSWTDLTADIVMTNLDSKFNALFQCQVVDGTLFAAGAGFLASASVSDL